MIFQCDFFYKMKKSSFTLLKTLTNINIENLIWKIFISKSMYRTPLKRRTTRGSSRTPPRGKSRSELIKASKKFTNAVIGINTNVVTLSNLTNYFLASNQFYCRNGDGATAANSCMQSIKEQYSSDEDLESKTANTKTICSREQLTAYFLNTLTKDENRIDRMEPLLNRLLKEQKNKSRRCDSKTTETNGRSREENVIRVTTAAEKETERRVNVDEEHEQNSLREREKNQIMADRSREENVIRVTTAAEKERERRANVDKEHEQNSLREREKNQKIADQLMEEERSRRISIDQRSKMGEQLLKERNIKLVSEMVMKERVRLSTGEDYCNSRYYISGQLKKEIENLQIQLEEKKIQLQLSTESTKSTNNGNAEEKKVDSETKQLRAAALDMFHKADNNLDGKLTKTEIRNFLSAHPEQKQLFRVAETGWKGLWSAMLKDGDQQMTEKEWCDYVEHSIGNCVKATITPPVVVWEGKFGQKNQVHISASMIDQNPSKSSPAPSFLSTVSDIVVVGRSPVDKVDKYTQNSNNKSIFVFELHVKSENSGKLYNIFW
jgi:hypothetical protein